MAILTSIMAWVVGGPLLLLGVFMLYDGLSKNAIVIPGVVMAALGALLCLSSYKLAGKQSSGGVLGLLGSAGVLLVAIFSIPVGDSAH